MQLFNNPPIHLIRGQRGHWAGIGVRAVRCWSTLDTDGQVGMHAHQCGHSFFMVECSFLETPAGANRRVEKLNSARIQLLEVASNRQSGSRIEVQSVDVTVFDQVCYHAEALHSLTVIQPLPLPLPPILHQSQVQRAMSSAQGALGPIDILICNAGAAEPGYFHEQGVEVFERMVR